MRVGFGSASLWSSWQTDRPLEDEIGVVAMVAQVLPSRYRWLISSRCFLVSVERHARTAFAKLSHSIASRRSPTMPAYSSSIRHIVSGVTNSAWC